VTAISRQIRNSLLTKVRLIGHTFFRLKDWFLYFLGQTNCWWIEAWLVKSCAVVVIRPIWKETFLLFLAARQTMRCGERRASAFDSIWGCSSSCYLSALGLPSAPDQLKICPKYLYMWQRGNVFLAQFKDFNSHFDVGLISSRGISVFGRSDTWEFAFWFTDAAAHLPRIYRNIYTCERDVCALSREL